jgi:beta-N-acetylhexosaminidase
MGRQAEKAELLWRGVWGLDASDISGPRAGGAVIFARNLDPDPEAGPERLLRLNQAIQRAWGADCPIAVAIDQEGGRVSRLRAWTGETPSLRQIWLGGGAEGCGLWGRLWGRGLGLLGVSVNFAPVLDLFDGREDMGLGDRCASSDPEDVCIAAKAFLDGLESTGVRSCLKHFPGLGGTQVDSHHAMPSIEDPSVIARNAGPFRCLAKPESLVMVAHLRTPESNGLPASLHRGHVAENPWGVKAQWIPDDLEMGGCVAPDWRTRARLALEAGHIALLVCQTQDAVGEAAEAAEALDDRLASNALESFRAFRKSLRPIPEAFDKSAWGAWIGEVRQQSEKLAQM